jgi:uncharacterized membrane protein YdbT with pleckstrin-like domain
VPSRPKLSEASWQEFACQDGNEKEERMLYVEKTLASDEQVLAVGKLHWSYSLGSLLWLIFLGWAIIGIIVFLKRFVYEVTTEVAVTNRRFVYKRGFLSRKTDEFSTARIEGVNLSQSFIGRIFNYGELHIRGSGIGEVDLPPIARPLEFRRAMVNANAQNRETLADPLD